MSKNIDARITHNVRIESDDSGVWFIIGDVEQEFIGRPDVKVLHKLLTEYLEQKPVAREKKQRQ